MRASRGDRFRLLLLAPVLLFAAPVIAEASRPIVPDAVPYRRIHQQVDWTAPDGTRLAFCLLGLEGESGGRTVAVYRRKGSTWERLFLDRDRSTRPWKLALGELDGDELPEVLVAVRKATRFDPVVRNRLFVFDWTPGNTLFPKWLGSRLGGPLVDFAVIPGSDDRARVAVTEQTTAGITRVRQYRWSGFGFVLVEGGKGE